MKIVVKELHMSLHFRFDDETRRLAREPIRFLRAETRENVITSHYSFSIWRNYDTSIVRLISPGAGIVVFADTGVIRRSHNREEEERPQQGLKLEFRPRASSYLDS